MCGRAGVSQGLRVSLLIQGKKHEPRELRAPLARRHATAAFVGGRSVACRQSRCDTNQWSDGDGDDELLLVEDGRFCADDDVLKADDLPKSRRRVPADER